MTDIHELNRKRAEAQSYVTTLGILNSPVKYETRLQGRWYPRLTRQGDSGSTSKEVPASPNLIAAAPAMYAALQETVLQLQYLADKFGETGTGAAVLARVNDALAKAERRTP
jgi:hypothetical protein